MALTSEILRANTLLAPLTDEQIQAITTLSANDENVVIAQRIGEIYGGLDADILSSTGIAKEGTEKTYNYLKRVLSNLKDKTKGLEDQSAKIKALEDEKKKLEEAIKGGGSDETLKTQYEQAIKDLENAKTEYGKLDKKLKATEVKYQKELSDLEVTHAINSALKGFQFKEDVSKSLIDVALNNVIAQVKGFSPTFEDDKDGTKVLRFKDSNGVTLVNKANNLEPYTTEELIAEKLADYGVLKEKRNVGGAGSKGGKEDGNGTGSKTATLVDLSEAKTRVEANDLIEKVLIEKGLVKGSEKFEQESSELWKEHNVSELPLE